MHDVIKENYHYIVIFKLCQNKITLRSYLSDLSLFQNSNKSKGFRSSIEYIYNQLVQMNDEVLTFDDNDTCYLYISTPKRGCKRVFDVRTAISNPNRQICFQELENNSCKMLFSKRTKPLNYDNRFEYAPMRVMSEKEQSKEIDNFGVKKDATATSDTDTVNDVEENVKDKDGSDVCDGNSNSSSSSNENSGNEIEKIKQDRNAFNGGGRQDTNNFLCSKGDKEKKTSQPGFFTKKQKVEQKVEQKESRGARKRKLSNESDSDDSDSTVIFSDEDKMYTPRRVKKKLYKKSSRDRNSIRGKK